MVLPHVAYDRYRKTVDLRYIRHFCLPIVFVVGKPCSGKASLCNFLVSKYDLSYISVGQLLRDEVSTNSPLGRQLGPYVLHVPSKVVPQELVMRILRDAITKLLYQSKPIIIQGFPRNYSQAAEFENEGIPIKHMFYMNVSDEVSKSRSVWQNQYCRELFSLERVEKRIESFKTDTIPVIDVLKQQKRVVELSSETGTEILEQASEIYRKWLQEAQQKDNATDLAAKLTQQASTVPVVAKPAIKEFASTSVKGVHRAPPKSANTHLHRRLNGLSVVNKWIP